MKFESFAATHPQNGRTQNEDDFLIGRGNFPLAAVADGAGNANQAARKALGLFHKLHNEAESSPAALLDPETWKKWVRLLDSSLLGGSSQTTFCAVNVGDVQDGEGKRKTVAVGAAVGDSRLYLLSREGKLTIVTEGAKKARLGSGSAEPFTFKLDLLPGDVLLLLSDGAWTPIPASLLQRTVTTAAVRHFSDVPSSVLDVAGKNGFADDATCVALRVR